MIEQNSFLSKMFLSNMIKNPIWECWKPDFKCGNVCGNVQQGSQLKKFIFWKKKKYAQSPFSSLWTTICLLSYPFLYPWSVLYQFWLLVTFYQRYVHGRSLFLNLFFTQIIKGTNYNISKSLSVSISSTLFNWLISQYIDFWLPHIFKIQNKWFYWVILTFQHHRHISLITTKVYKSQWKFLETTLSCFNLHKCKRLRTSADDEIVMLKEWGFPL